MIFQRGNPLDYERWGAVTGMGAWDYAHCLPYFKRMESCLAGADEWRGSDGPLKLERGPAINSLCQAFFKAVPQAGYPLTDDVNGYRQEGFAAFDRTISAGIASVQRVLTCIRCEPDPTSRFAAARSSAASCSKATARWVSKRSRDARPTRCGRAR